MVMMFTSGVFSAAQERIQRRRLSAPGGPGDEDHPLVPGEHRPDGTGTLRLEAQSLDVHDFALERQETEDHFFAVYGRQRRHPHVHGRIAKRHPGPAVLRRPAVGDVQVGHHLDPRDDAPRQPLGQLHRLLQRAVDTKANDGLVLPRFDVHVRRPRLDGLLQDEVHHPDAGRVADLVLRRLNLLALLVLAVLLDDVARPARHAHEALVRPADLARSRHQGADLKTGQGPDVVQRVDVVWIRHGEVQGPVCQLDGKHEVAPDHFGRDQGEQLA